MIYAEKTFTFRGKVIDGFTNEKVERASVVRFSNGKPVEGLIITDENGKFETTLRGCLNLI